MYCPLLLEGLEMEAFYGYGRPTEQAGERANGEGSIMFNVNWNSLLLFSAAALSGGRLSILIPRRESFAHMPPRGTSSFT